MRVTRVTRVGVILLELVWKRRFFDEYIVDLRCPVRAT